MLPVSKTAGGIQRVRPGAHCFLERLIFSDYPSVLPGEEISTVTDNFPKCNPLQPWRLLMALGSKFSNGFTELLFDFLSDHQ